MAETTPPEPQGQAGIRRRLIAGTAGKFLSLAITFGEQILLVPIFLYFWGPDRFADWTALIAAAGFVTLADMGLQNYYSNGLQLALSKGDRDGFSKMLREAAALYAAIAVIILGLVTAIAQGVDWRATLNLSATAPGAMQSVILLLGLYFLAMMPFGLCNSVYRAHGDFTLSIMASNLLKLGLILAIIFALWFGISAAGLAVVHIVVALAGWAGLILHQKHRYNGLRYGIKWPDRPAFRAMFAVAPLYALVLGATTLTTHGTIIMVSALAANGSAAALMYRTVRTLIGLIRLVPDQIMQVTGVEIARQYAQADAASLDRTYRFFSRFAGGLTGGFAGMLAFIAPPFFPLWTLGDIAMEPMVFWPLLAAAAVAAPSLAGSSVLFFINKPAGMAGAHIGAAALTLVLCLVLIPRIGAAGAAWAVLAAEALILATIIPWQTARIIGGNPLRMIFHAHFFAATSFAISAAASWIGVALAGSDSIAQLVIAGIIWAGLAALPAWFLLFGKIERAWVIGQIRKRTGAGTG